MVQFVVFMNQESFERFRDHPLHVEIKEKLKYNADWDSGDLDFTNADLAALRSIEDQ
jgi:hypothetical protein